MKQPLTPGILPDGAVLVTCSSHEDRCKGLLTHMPNWAPSEVVLFHYDDPNPIREKNHRHMESVFRNATSRLTVLGFTEADAVNSLRENMLPLRQAVGGADCKAVVIDISVFTKRHLLRAGAKIDSHFVTWVRWCSSISA